MGHLFNFMWTWGLNIIFQFIGYEELKYRMKESRNSNNMDVGLELGS